MEIQSLSRVIFVFFKIITEKEKGTVILAIPLLLCK